MRMRLFPMKLLIIGLVCLELLVAVSANIGFEFETPISIETFPKGFTPKKSAVIERVLLAPTSFVAFEMQLDEMDLGSVQIWDIEFVAPPTAGYPQAHPADYKLVCNAFNKFVHKLNKLKLAAATGTPTHHSSRGDGHAFTYLNKDKKEFPLYMPINKQRGFGAAPQVTIGLPYNRVFLFFKEVTRAHGDLRVIANMEKHGSDMQFYADLVERIDNTGLSAQLKAFVLFLVDLRCNGGKSATSKSYGKLYLTNLCRSDLGQMYTLLSATDKEYLTGNNKHSPAVGLQQLVETIGDTLKCRGIMKSGDPWSPKLFLGGWDNAKNVKQRDITAEEFFKSLVEGKNLLKGGDMDSFGTLPASQDDVVFELRRMKRLDDNVLEWAERSMDVYDFAYQLRHASDHDAVMLRFTNGQHKNKPTTDPTRCEIH